MTVLLTGGTGIVGNAIAQALVAAGRPVRALVRSPDRARGLLPSAVELCPGDVTDAGSVRRAVTGAAAVYHAAGLPEQWLPDPDRFRQVNVEGSRIVAEAARDARVQRFVYVSTIDVFAWRAGEPFDETVLDPSPKGTVYERSKQDADRLVASLVRDGLPAVFLHPSGLYGPAPAGSPGLNDFIRDVVLGAVPMLLPGGLPIVYAPDLARGALAAEACPPGSRFILSDRYWSLVDLARATRDAAGRGRVPPVLPGAVAHLVAAGGELLARLLGTRPLIPRGQLHFLESGAHPSAARAGTMLGWRPTPFAEAVGPTLAWVLGRQVAAGVPDGPAAGSAPA